jgi:hypothetical protein
MALFYGDFPDVDIHLAVSAFSNILDLEGTIVQSGNRVSFLRDIATFRKLYDDSDARTRPVPGLGFRPQDGAILSGCSNRKLTFEVDRLRPDSFVGQLSSLAYVEQSASWHQTGFKKLPASNSVTRSGTG